MSQWPMVKLGDVCTVVGGGTPKTAIPEYWGGTIPWLTPKDLSGNKNLYISRGERSITESGLDNSGATLLPKGTVLWSSRAPIGHVAIAETDVATNQGFKSFIPGPNVDSEYLAYTLIFMKDQLQEIGTGATFKEISAKRAKSIPIPLPPLEEQRRIAKILQNSTFSIDSSWREIELLHNLRNSQFVPSNTSEKVHLDELVTVRSGQVDPTLPDYQDHLLVAPDSIKSHYSTFNTISTCAKVGVIGKKCKFSAGDVLYSKIRPYLNKVVIPSFDGVCSADMYVINPKPGVSSEYVRAVLMSPHFLAYAEKKSKGANIPRINRKALLSYSLPKPTQEDITVATTRIREIDNAIAKMTKRMRLMEELHQSLATRAFAGQL